jgi:hypothetical protein
MQRLDVSVAVRPLYGSLGVKELMYIICNAISKQILDRAQWDIHILQYFIGSCYKDANTPHSTWPRDSTVFKFVNVSTQTF